jgi:hypothetical protein
VRAHDPIGQPRERQRLNPDAARSGHRREEEPFPAEERGPDAADKLDVVLHRRVERRQASRVHAQLLPGLQFHRDHRAAAVDEDVAGAFQALQDEAFAAEEAGAEPLGEFDVDVDVAGGAEEGVALAENRAVLQRHLQNLARIGPAERHFR